MPPLLELVGTTDDGWWPAAGPTKVQPGKIKIIRHSQVRQKTKITLPEVAI